VGFLIKKKKENNFNLIFSNTTTIARSTLFEVILPRIFSCINICDYRFPTNYNFRYSTVISYSGQKDIDIP
jgi:hypothetical protein